MNEIDRISRRALSRRIFKHRMAVRSWVLLGITLSSALALVGFMLFGPSLTPEDDRHEQYAGRLWPTWKFEREPAVLYRDKGEKSGLTWHVCTARACGHYFEVPEEKFGPEESK